METATGEGEMEKGGVREEDREEGGERRKLENAECRLYCTVYSRRGRGTEEGDEMTLIFTS